jgi:hypothetical protein
MASRYFLSWPCYFQWNLVAIIFPLLGLEQPAENAKRLILRSSLSCMFLARGLSKRQISNLPHTIESEVCDDAPCVLLCNLHVTWFFRVGIRLWSLVICTLAIPWNYLNK